MSCKVKPFAVLPLRARLLQFLLVVAIALAATGVFLPTYQWAQQNRDVADQLASTRREEIATYFSEQIQATLLAAESVSLMNSRLISDGTVSASQHDRLAALFARQIDAIPQVDTIALGFANGDLVSVDNQSRWAQTWDGKHLFSIRNQEYRGSLHFLAIDAATGKVTGNWSPEVPDVIGYDVTKRPWYKSAADSPRWSPMFTYAGEESSYVVACSTTVLSPDTKSAIGVSSAMVSLPMVDKFLWPDAYADLKGRALLVNGKGQVLADSTAPRVPRLGDLGDPPVKSIDLYEGSLPGLASRFSRFTTSPHSGTELFELHIPYDILLGSITVVHPTMDTDGWYLVLLLPRNGFGAHVSAASSALYIATLISVITAAFLGATLYSLGRLFTALDRSAQFRVAFSDVIIHQSKDTAHSIVEAIEQVRSAIQDSTVNAIEPQLQSIRRLTEELKQLCDTQVLFLKSEVRLPHLLKQMFDPRKLLQTACASSVSYSVSSTVPKHLCGPREIILLVLQLLLDNAQKATESTRHEQRVSVAADWIAHSQCMQFAVSDNGEGLSQEHWDRLCTIASKDSASHVPGDVSTGVSLYMSHCLVSTIHGSLTRAEPTQPFTTTIELTIACEPVDVNTIISLDGISDAVIYDDVELWRGEFSALLQQRGIAVREVSSADEVLPELLRGKADLLLIDYRISDTQGRNGLDIARESLRTSRSLKRIIIASNAPPDVCEVESRITVVTKEQCVELLQCHVKTPEYEAK